MVIRLYRGYKLLFVLVGFVTLQQIWLNSYPVLVNVPSLLSLIDMNYQLNFSKRYY